MDFHANHALGLPQRLALVQAIERGSSLRAAAAALSVAPATAHRWWHRWLRASDEERRSRSCLRDRSSRPVCSPRRLSGVQEAPILRARQETNLGPGRLAGLVRRARSTVWKVLWRNGLSRRIRGERQSFRRYEWSRPGALLHMDVKRLARFDAPGHRTEGRRAGYKRSSGAGWEFLHCVVDDHSRLAYVELHARDSEETNIACLERALRWFSEQGLSPPEAVMTDGAMVYRRSRRFRALVASIGARHILTPPYTPRWNGNSSASSRRFRTSGPTLTATRAQETGRGVWEASSATTTERGHTARWETGRRSAVFPTSVGRTSREKRCTGSESTATQRPSPVRTWTPRRRRRDQQGSASGRPPARFSGSSRFAGAAGRAAAGGTLSERGARCARTGLPDLAGPPRVGPACAGATAALRDHALAWTTKATRAADCARRGTGSNVVTIRRRSASNSSPSTGRSSSRWSLRVATLRGVMRTRPDT